MNPNKIGKFIKEKRLGQKLTQKDLAKKLYVTEKAISRWETGYGIPDISLLTNLSKVLKVEISEILNGEETKKDDQDNLEKLITYSETNRDLLHKLGFKLSITCYTLSLIIFLLYLKLEYDPISSTNYFIKLLIALIASALIIMGNKIYIHHCIDKIADKNRITKFSTTIIFIYYTIFLFNVVLFARMSPISPIRLYNITPLKTIKEVSAAKDAYSFIINILGNYFIFMPLEYFLITIFNMRKFFLNCLIAFLIIIAIEITQYIFNIGIFDVDDIIICTLGMITINIIFNLKQKKK